MRYWLFTEPTDMRKSFHMLSGIVNDRMSFDLRNGDVFIFINKNRKERIKLAQMAMEKGQPIPDELLKEKQKLSGDDDYQTGIRQMFTGVGLAIFLGIVIGKVGFGIGALVFFIGLGKWFIARQSGIGRNNAQFDNTTDISNNINHSDNEQKTDTL